MINKYPYSDMHELNADWLLSKTVELEGKVKTLEDAPKGVTNVTPYYNSGTKIADYEQDGVTGEIYIPNNPAVLEKSAINRFDDGINSYFKKVVSSIQCVQTGSGVPSPSNHRPIYGFNDCTVTDVDNLDTPTETNTATISFGAAGTVYGAYVELISGKLVVDKGIQVVDGNSTILYEGSASNFKYFTVTSESAATNPWQTTNIISNMYTNILNTFPRIQYDSNRRLRIVYSISDPVTASDLTALFTATPLTVIYPLATPQEYQLTPTQLRSLVGANRLTSSTGEVTRVEYITNETIAWLLDRII